MAPPDRIAGAAGARLFLSKFESAPDADRADVLSRRLDRRISDRLEQIRSQMKSPPVSPNTDQTGTRLDIHA